jgi:hypothetical protein
MQRFALPETHPLRDNSLLRLHLPILLWLAAVPAAHPQQQAAPAQNPARSVHIQRAAAKVEVDGRLDEAVWQTIAPITEFTQTEPDLGQPVSEKTEVRIFYDDHNLYFGFRCYDSQPEKIIRRLGAHDGFTNSDSVDIFLDTFHDRRTGYYFSVNARGIQFDATSNEGGNNQNGDNFSRVHDSTWDGIWQSAAALQPWGWSAEVVIPFKSMRISRAAEQVWGLNLSRTIVRKYETAYWEAVTRFDSTMRPSKAGTMEGLENLHIGRNLELIPFFGTKYRRARWQPEHAGTSFNGGLDARYGLASNLTANVSINPDFGETESDEFTAQISRFEIFFPEKRKFFTEGANYFTTPLQLFFSRRIGSVLPDGEPQRILEGAKITGKAGAWTLGALEAVTQRHDFIDPASGEAKSAAGAFFGVVRLQRNLLQKSALGFISVNRLQSGTVFDVDGNLISGQETAQGIDLNILHGDHISWASQFLANTNALHPGFDAQHLAWTSNFSYDSEKFSYSTGGRFLGRNTDFSTIGFEPEIDRWGGFMAMEYKPFVNRWWTRQLFFNLNYDEANGTHGELQDSGTDASVAAQFKNFWRLEGRLAYDRVRFNEFAPCDSTAACDARPTPSLASMRLYIMPRFVVHLTSNQNKPFSFNARFVHGKLVQYDEFIYGSRTQLELSMNARLGERLRWELSGTQVRESLQNHAHFQNRNFLISRWQYQFTPKLRARLLAQYSGDHHRTDISINSLLAYDFTARSAVYLGYNRQRRSPLDPADLGDVIFAKISYLFSF